MGVRAVREGRRPHSQHDVLPPRQSAASMKFFGAAEAAGFTVRRGRQQVMLYHRERKVGGWNTRNAHWYVSRIMAQNRDELLLQHGFRWREKRDHAWWQLDGIENASTFAAVVEGLTGTRIDPGR